MSTKRKRASKKKNSLVANINRRKRAGKSRPKSRSTVSSSAYRNMQKGWPKSKSSKKKASKKKSSKKKASKSKRSSKAK